MDNHAEKQPTTLDEARAYIDSIDFSMIINKMVEHQGWLRRHVKEVCEQYRRFLYLNKRCAGSNKTLPPSEDIDEFWHNHILDTKKYTKDCQIIFGKYFHHLPLYQSSNDNKLISASVDESFKETQKYYFEEYGDYLYQVRNRISKFLSLIKKNLKAPKKAGV